jgi:hypothetical protein
VCKVFFRTRACVMYTLLVFETICSKLDVRQCLIIDLGSVWLGCGCEKSVVSCIKSCCVLRAMEKLKDVWLN